MKEKQKNLWGIDLGGTKIEGVVLESKKSPKVLHRFRLPTLADKGYQVVLSQIEKVVDHLKNESGTQPEHLGICTPGIMDRSTGLLKNCNAECMNGHPVETDLTHLLGVQVTMANDAHCFALAEALLGSVPDVNPEAKVVFGVILGTGVGGGLVVNGQIIRGYHGIGGEWGHNYLLPGQGRECFCGKNGCNESILAGPSLEWFYEKKTGTRKSMKEIVDLARKNTDPIAVETLDRLITYFPIAISTIVNIVDPDVIVLGGGLSNIKELYDEGVKNLDQEIFDDKFLAKIVPPKLGDSAGVFGAAFLNS